MEIRSFRVVFAFERRLHRIDRWRLPLPYGIPLRGLAYFAGILVAILLADALPAVDDTLDALPAPIRYLGLPGGCAFLLARVRVDGRPAHRALPAWMRHALGPSHLDAFRSITPAGPARLIGEVVVERGLGSPRLERGTLRGAATVELNVPIRGRRRGLTIVVAAAGDQRLRAARRIVVPAGGRLVVR